MIEEYAWLKIIRCNKDAIWAEVISENTCSGATCGSSGIGCQTNAFARLLTDQPLLKIPQSDPLASVGDELLVALPSAKILQASLWVYGSALVALLSGIALGQWLYNDWVAFGLGLIAMLSSWMAVNRLFLSVVPRICDIRRHSGVH